MAIRGASDISKVLELDDIFTILITISEIIRLKILNIAS